MEPTRDYRPVTRLGLWLTGVWPVTEGDESADPGSTERTDNVGSSLVDRIAALARLAEQTGFDSLWVTDDVPPGGTGSSGRSEPEAYSLLGALAARTHGIRLGAIPLGEDRRAPSIVAKIVTGLDVVSHGRAVLTYGLGPTDAVRGARATEALRVGRALLEDEAPTFEGAFYSVLDARNKPGPVQEGGIPVVVFVEHPGDLAVVAVAEFVGLADAVIVPGGTDVRRLVDEVRSTFPPPESDQGGHVGPLQLIGIVPMTGTTRLSEGSEGSESHPVGLDPDTGQTGSGVGVAVRDLFDAGVDGCIVAADLATAPEVLAAIAAGPGEWSTRPAETRSPPATGR